MAEEETSLRLHVFFSYSAERTFKLLIRRNQVPHSTVISTSDYFMHGPVADLFSGAKRKAWIQEFDPRYFDPWYLNDEDNAYYEEMIDEFWGKIDSHKGPITIWTSQSSPADWTGYIASLNFIDKAKDIDVIDVGSKRHPYLQSQSVGSQSSVELKDALASARTVEESDWQLAKTEFARLSIEPSAMRIIKDGTLTSVPIDILDQAVLSKATTRWQKSARIVGDVMGHGMFHDSPETNIPASDWFITLRLVALVETNMLEAMGDPYEIRSSEIRLPQKQSG